MGADAPIEWELQALIEEARRFGAEWDLAVLGMTLDQPDADPQLLAAAALANGTAALTGDPSTDLAIALLVSAVGSGVRDVVVCPGSRSQALALVAAELERVGRIRLHVRHDERSAAFFALGLARETRAPVPIIVTSGTAVANLHPAMLEAHHAGIPLIALTADRPPELIGIGANQATRQDGLFGPLIPTLPLGPNEGVDDVAEALKLGRVIGWVRRPLHLNVAFRDPLSTSVPDLRRLRLGGARMVMLNYVPMHVLSGFDDVPTVVIAGADAGHTAADDAEREGWPLIAEVSSGARFGRNLVTGYRELLGPGSPVPELRDGIRRIIVYGHPTLSRHLPALLAREDIEAVVVAGRGEPVGRDRPGLVRTRPLHLVESGAPGPGVDVDEVVRSRRRWLGAWVRASRELERARSSDAAAPDVDASRSDDRAERAAFARAELAVGREPVTREMLVDAVWRASWPHDRLVLGASRLIRDLDERAAGKTIAVHANRGLAGIDGTIATALGVAAGSQLPLPEAEAEAARREALSARLQDELHIGLDVWDEVVAHLLSQGVVIEDVDDLVAYLLRDEEDAGDGGDDRAGADADADGGADDGADAENGADAGPDDGTSADADADAGVDPNGDEDDAELDEADEAWDTLGDEDDTDADDLWHDRPGARRSVHGTTRVLLGDVAFLHDASSLLVGQGGEPAPRLQIIVGNDGGGTIFDSLEVAATAGAAFDRVLYTPTSADLGAIARAYGWEHVVAGTRAELDAALLDVSRERVIIEVPLPR